MNLNNFSSKDASFSVFEINIRFVGGFLSCYALTGDPFFKVKAKYVADKLLPAFNSQTGVPNALVNLKTGYSENHGWIIPSAAILAEFGTLSLEFNYLSDTTGEQIYRKKVEKIKDVMKKMVKPDDLYFSQFDNQEGDWKNGEEMLIIQTKYVIITKICY